MQNAPVNHILGTALRVAHTKISINGMKHNLLGPTNVTLPIGRVKIGGGGQSSNKLERTEVGY